MTVVELKDAASGELYRVHPDDVSLIVDEGADGECTLTLAGKRLVVVGSTAEILKKISGAVREP